jgi:predicted phosphodiesterase
MRILHVTDFHASDALYGWLSRESDGFDLVALSGDLLDLNHPGAVGDQIDRVLAHMKLIAAPLALCSGNHDSVAGSGPRLKLASWLKAARREKVWIDGDLFEIGGYRFRCIPWSGKLPDAKPEEIWLIHSPPDEAPTGISQGGSGWGNFEFGELCRSSNGPRLALSGHVHEPQSWRAKVGRTWSLNPGCPDHAHMPNHVMIDLARGFAIRTRASGEKDLLRLT